MKSDDSFIKEHILPELNNKWPGHEWKVKAWDGYVQHYPVVHHSAECVKTGKRLRMKYYVDWTGPCYHVWVEDNV